MFNRWIILLTGMMLISPLASQADAVSDLLASYRQQTSEDFSATQGAVLWNKEFPDPKSGQVRDCALCHTGDLTKPGKHRRTGKPINPIAPSANPESLTDTRKIEKWFKRNCKWTLGRECTPQEKGDLLTFLRHQ